MRDGSPSRPRLEELGGMNGAETTARILEEYRRAAEPRRLGRFLYHRELRGAFDDIARAERREVAPPNRRARRARGS